MEVGRALALAAALALAGAAEEAGALQVPTAGEEGSGPLALVGATLVDGGADPVEDATVVVRDGRVECAGPRSRCPVPADARTVALEGRWIIPGLVDGHVHYSQTGWADGRPDQGDDLRERFPYAATVAENRRNPARYQRAYLCSGVTTTLDVGGYPWTWDLREPTESDPLAPRVGAAGPLVSARDHWLNVPGERQFLHMASEAAVDTAARYVVAHDPDWLKVWYLVSEDTPDAASYQAMLRVAARRAEEAGVPLIVHATNLWAAKDALRAGARHLVHSVQDRPVDEEFLRLAREGGASYNPTLVVGPNVGLYHMRRFDPSLFPMECVDPGTREKVRSTNELPMRLSEERVRALEERYRERSAVMEENLRRVHAAGIPVVMGTDAGNTLTLHGASVFQEMEAMQAAGLTPRQVLEASTRNGGRLLGRDDVGTLRAGSVADLVALAADPTADVANVRRIEAVMRAGVLHRREELEYR